MLSLILIDKLRLTLRLRSLLIRPLWLLPLSQRRWWNFIGIRIHLLLPLSKQLLSGLNQLRTESSLTFELAHCLLELI